MPTVASLKGVRTKYRKVVITELQKANDLLKSEVSAVSEIEFLKDVQKCKSLLKSYSEKLMSQMDKLSERLTKSDSEYLQQIVDEDCNLNFEVENCIIDLDQFCESTVPLKHDEKEKETYQEQMQKMMMTQIEQQHQMMVQMQTDRKNTSAVKLPKLDLDMFYGNKINWWEFWDSFESIVHRNTKLSNIEKFNYLLSKLSGEAKRALAGLARTNDNYSIAVGILRERYGNKQEIIDLHYKEMVNVHSPTTKVESLRFFLD
ncbi:uncharacterized protein LOC132724504 [Ruditapes philippinarum]|uniref:uncharacterized protein LOC132724504 n=1 Tax=Ruditapes philippinarum TaxID=129788 RepID=UPI00295B63A7|nr:uncharacterized protein LOC132724504 [Ruditapes philippinarum]